MVIEAWPNLSMAIRTGIIAMIEAARFDDKVD
jgi:hypothetical protein